MQMALRKTIQPGAGADYSDLLRQVDRWLWTHLLGLLLGAHHNQTNGCQHEDNQSDKHINPRKVALTSCFDCRSSCDIIHLFYAIAQKSILNFAKVETVCHGCLELAVHHIPSLDQHWRHHVFNSLFGASLKKLLTFYISKNFMCSSYISIKSCSFQKLCICFLL